MKKLIYLFVVFVSGLAHADTYKEITTEHKPRTLVTGRDTFPERLRYWFVMDDGNSSVYEVVEKNQKGEWVDLMHPGENPALIIKGNTLQLEHRYVGKTVSVERYEKIAE